MTIQQLLVGGGPRKIYLTVSATAANYNVRVSAGNPSDVVEVLLTVSSGITVYSVSPLSPSLTTGTGWASGSVLRIVNNGNIYGCGGDGGTGGDYNTNGGSGLSGGDAVNLGINVTIDNTNGFIFGGGGGGGGGGGHQVGLGAAGGGGGGGGQGRNGGDGGLGGDAGVGGGPGAQGQDGSISFAGDGGAGGVDPFYGTTAADGGNGGAWGASGDSGDSSPTRSGGSGGSGGKAVDLNGFTVTWLGGNTAARVKGAVS